jgi:RNA polymerase sigma factor, sigma-70 family
MVPSCHGKKHCIGTSRAAIGWRKRGGVFMLSIALYLLTHAMLLSLHLSGGSFPRPLSAQEEKKYVERMLAGDIEARNVLVEHNLRLVAHIAKKYYTQSDEQDDLISIGTIGLIKGVSSYRPEKGTRLATYAAKCVENTILT